MLRLSRRDSVPGRGGVNTGTIVGNGISFFAHHVVLCLVMWEFTKRNVTFAQFFAPIAAENHATFSLGSHSQANEEDASLDPCECKQNGESEAIVHQGEVILVCSTPGNFFLEVLGT